MSEAVGNWDEIAPWWRREATTDPVYREDIEPMLGRLMPLDSGTVVELGCGEGQWLRWLSAGGIASVGCDRSMRLLSDALPAAPVVCAGLPDLSWLKEDVVDTGLSVFVLDLIADASAFFGEAARVVKPGGGLVIVINHPGFTAPGSGPVVDLDGEVLWRWGSYLDEGSSTQPAGDAAVEFHHRSMATLLNVAAAAGWSLEVAEEAPLGAAAIAREPAYARQEKIPRILGVRWRRESRVQGESSVVSHQSSAGRTED